MDFFTIILFFVYAYGLGYGSTLFVKNSEHFWERNIMRLGIGLGVFPLLAVVLHLFRIPIDWRIFLAISLVPLLYGSFKTFFKEKKFGIDLRLTKSNLNILIVFLLFLVLFYVFASGAFKYSWLEDTDPWDHARVVKYMSIEKTFHQPGFKLSHYLEPYPPGFDILMAVLYQTSHQMIWMLKFFNALLVSFSVLFFYFFVKEFTNDKDKALFAAFALAALPSFLTHFVWSQTLALMLFFPAFYSAEMIKHDKRWVFVCAIVIAGLLMTQPSAAIIFGLFFALYFITKTILTKKFQKNIFFAGALGLIASFAFWLPAFLNYGYNYIATEFDFIGSPLNRPGTGDRVYNLVDFLVSPAQNMINNPTGIGIFLSALVIIAVVFALLKFKDLIKEENHWLVIALVWLAFTLYGVNSANLPVKLMPFRFWAFLAIPICILAAQGLYYLFSISKEYGIPKFLVLLIVLIGVLITSAYPKYVINTSVWGADAAWASYDEMIGYASLSELPFDTKIFPLCSEEHKVIAYDKFTCFWCSEIIDYKKNAIMQSPEQLKSWLNQQGYDYLLVDASCINSIGVNQTNNKIQELVASNRFVVDQRQGLLLFKV